MSIAELRERLEFNKRQLEQETDFKRETNLHAKEKELQKLRDDQRAIEEARARRAAQNNSRRSQKAREQAELAAKQQAAREKGLIEVNAKI